MFTRRRFLLAAGTTLSLSGCLGDSEPSARVAELRLINQSNSSRRFDLEIEADGETVYDETHAVAPAEEEPVPVVNDLPSERGRVTVTTRVLGTDAADSVTYEDDKCHRLIVEYEQGSVGYYSTTGGEACKTTTES
ncbi:hypothetical protein [Halorussus pelagicus]|uniref:hypothetical protein n=1 Tax=Halorussus pelagicus TaxID=2505977 RepID=UPI000FFC1DE8|nr:hypothetical protein [Halorussus pelagicus]